MTPAQQQFRSELDALATMCQRVEGQHSIYSYVLEHGRFWNPLPFPKRLTLRLPRQCFYNSQRLASRTKLLYVEGFSMSSHDIAFPIHHAWCVDGDDVVDSTWRPVGLVYFGVAFDMPFVRKQLAGNKATISVLDNWEKRWPLLRTAA